MKQRKVQALIEFQRKSTDTPAIDKKNSPWRTCIALRSNSFLSFTSTAPLIFNEIISGQFGYILLPTEFLMPGLLQETLDSMAADGMMTREYGSVGRWGKAYCDSSPHP